MPDAARKTDPTSQGVVDAPCSPDTFIDNLNACRETDHHACPHGGGAVGPGSGTVFINNLAASRITDTAICSSPPNIIVAGCPTVIICG